MKHKIAVAVLASSSLLSIPYASHADNIIHGGVFLGAGASLTGTDYKFSQAPGPYLKHDSTQYKFRPDIYAGYGATTATNNVYLGFEVGMMLGSSDSDKVASTVTGGITTTRDAKQGNIYYADFLPGVMFGSNSNSMVYGILGAATTNFTLKQPNGADAFSSTKTAYGYRVGVGYNYAVSNHFSVGLKYVHSGYSNLDIKNQTIDYKLNPANNTISAGFTYTFGGSDNSDGLMS